MSLDTVVSSGGATVIAEAVTFPVCTLKTRYQTANKSIRETLLSLAKEEGFRAFYKGIFPAVIGQTYSTSSKYFFYRYLDNRLQATGHKNVDRVVNSVAGGILATTITHPLDVLKVRMQVAGIANRPIFERGLGFPGTFTTFLYLGYTKTISKSFVGGCLFFPLYDAFMDKTKNPLTSSVSTAIVSTTILHPIDYLKTRQISKKSLYDGLDPRIYYKGFSLNLLRTVPHFTLTMTLTELFAQKLKDSRA